MNRDRLRRLTQNRLIEKELVFEFPPVFVARAVCWVYGHEDVWEGKYQPHLAVCRWCGTTMDANTHPWG